MDAKIERLEIRLSHQDREKIKNNADLLGMNSSEFIRFTTALPFDILRAHSISECASAPNRIVLIDAESILLLNRELKKSGVNINQSTRALNTIARYVKRGLACPSSESWRALGEQSALAFQGYAEAKKTYEELIPLLENITSNTLITIPAKRGSKVM